MLVDRADDVGPDAGQSGVGRSDVPLELGKLTHELRCLIGLCEQCRLDGDVVAAELRDELHQAVGLVRKSARAAEERDRPQALGEPVDPDGEVPPVRELGVLESSAEHELVSRTNDLRVAAVGDECEAVAAQREVPLMRLHRRRHDALRQLEEPHVERALLHARLFDEVHDLVQLAGWVAPRPERVETGNDPLVPNRTVGLNPGGSERRQVLERASHLDSARIREPVPVREPAALDALERDLDRSIVELRAHPPHRPREPETGSPRHRLRELKPGHDRREPLGERLLDRDAEHLETEKAVPYGERVHGHAVLARKAGCSLLAKLLRRALHPYVLGSFGHRRRERQSARPDPQLVRDDTEVVLGQAGQLEAGLHAGCGRQLLAADLKQQLRHAPAVRGRAERRRGPGRECVRCTQHARRRRSHRARPTG